MQIQQSSHQGLSVLTLSGRLDLAAVPQVQGAIRKLGVDLYLAMYPWQPQRINEFP
jgi:hypothetical protein